MTVMEHTLTILGCMLAMGAVAATARDARTWTILAFAGPAMLALIMGKGLLIPLTAAPAPVNDAMIGVVSAVLIVHFIRLVRHASA